MSSPMMLLIIVIVLLIIWAVVVFNKLINLRNLVTEAWSGIDVQLKRRFDLVPNIVETVKGYASHEQHVLEEVTRIRGDLNKADSVKEREQGETGLSKSIKNLFALAESYPDLKANENFLSLQKALTQIEKDISMSRRYYNGTVRNLNILRESFPSMIIANLAGFKKADFFEIELATQREAPEIKLDK